MLAEGGLSYLSFGVQPPTPSWGQMIAQGQRQLTTAPWEAIIPCSSSP
jgi:peptide/nickel transport system permease protein